MFPLFFRRLAVALAASLLLPLSAFAADPPASRPLTVAAIFSDAAFTTEPPEGMSWSPDGRRLTYLSTDGDLMQVEGGTGVQSVLVPSDRLSTLTTGTVAEQDRDHRARYHMADYIWAPDSEHLLFDKDGQLWLFSTKLGNGLQLAQTGAGSGDDPKFSPDGTYISYVRDHNLLLRRLHDTRQPIHLTTTHEDTLLNGEIDWIYKEELDVRSNYFWSADGKSIAYLQMNEASVPRYPIVDWIPEHAKVEEQRYPQPGDPSPGVRLGVVNVSNGKTTWLKLPLDAGNDYLPRFGWLDHKIVWAETLSRDHKHRRLFFAEPSSGAVRQMLSDDDDRFFDEAYDVTFSANHILWTSWRDGHTQIYLYSFDANNPLSGDAKLERQLTQGSGDVDAIKAVDPALHLVYYLSNEGDPRQQQVWSVNMDGGDARQISKEPGFHEPVFSPNAKYFIDTFSSALVPPIVNMCHEERPCHTFWKSPSIEAFALPSTPQELTLKASEGTALYASLILPAGNTAKASVPLIVNPYGGPHAQTVQNKWGGRGLLFDQILAQHGFAVLHVDNRGMGGRGRAFAQAAYHNFGPVQLEDQLAATDQVLALHPELDPKRLGWWGWSWGGTFTLYALTHSDRFRAGVAVAPVTDWHDYDSIYTERYLGLPAQNSDVYRDDSVITNAGRLKGRLLIAHGTGDDNVHMENSIQFIQKLIDAGIPYDLQLFPRKTHSIAGPEARTELYSRILAHFETYLLHPGDAQ